MARYDLQRLLDFINSETSPKRRSKMTSEQIEAARQAAAEALTDFLADYCDVRAVLGLKKKKGGRGKIIDPKTVVMSDPVYAIAYRYVSGELTKPQAVNEAIKLNLPISNRTIGKLLEDLRPMVEITYQSFLNRFPNTEK